MTKKKKKKEREGAEFLEREKSRVRKYYVPMSERSHKDRTARREKVRHYVQEHRERKCLQNRQTEQCHVECMEVEENGVGSSTK